MTIDIGTLPPMLQLEAVGEHLYEGKPEHEGSDVARNVVFGGQILAQMIVAAHLDRNADRRTTRRSSPSTPSSPGRATTRAPIRYEVERMHDGRTLGSDTVTFSQARSDHVPGADPLEPGRARLIRHTDLVQMPNVAGPDDPGNRHDHRVFPGADGRIVDGVNTWSDDEPLRPAVQNVWTRLHRSFSPPVNQAILSWATDGYLIGTSMLPHEGTTRASP